MGPQRPPAVGSARRGTYFGPRYICINPSWRLGGGRGQWGAEEWAWWDEAGDRQGENAANPDPASDTASCERAPLAAPLGSAPLARRRRRGVVLEARGAC